jgi:hypothetical protein
MKTFLEQILPSLHSDISFDIYAFDGNSDLKSAVTRRVKAHCHMGSFVMVIMDQDLKDCLELKKTLLELCEKSGENNYKVRIVCRELESWYLGDLVAVGAAFSKPLADKQEKSKYRNPDLIIDAKKELKKLIGDFGQLLIAERIGQAMTASSIAENRSHSFHVFLNALTAG